MKSKLLLFVSFLAMGSLVACGGGNEDNGGDGDNNGGNNSINLPDTAQQAINKFYQLGQAQGFEITFTTSEDAASRESRTVGLKSNTLWIANESAYKEDGNNIESYDYNVQTNRYEFDAAVPKTDSLNLAYFAQTFTGNLYIGYNYVANAEGALTDVKDTQFLGRAAKEYTYSYTALDASGSVKLVFDNDTGITLKVYATAVAGADSSSVEYEVTSFKVGDAVTVPALYKNSGEGGEGGQGQGGEGQGGEGEQTTNVFANKLLVYVSNENANIYANSRLALFSDGKFELSFYDNGYLAVMLGEYTVDATNAKAVLSVKRVYKDQGHEYSQMSQAWELTYNSGAYELKVSERGKVNFNASAVAPTHADIPAEGGQGGQGEQGENEPLVNKVFTYESNQGASIYANSTLTLFQDGTFELEFTQSNYLVVYIGEYQVNENYDTMATLTVKKVYKAQNNEYVQFSQSWSFKYENNQYVLTVSASGKVIFSASNEQPMHADIPEDPNEGAGQSDQQFIVTSQVWAAMIEECDVVKMNSNFIAWVRSSDNQNGYTKYEFDSGKLRVETKNASGTDICYKEFFENGGCDSYHQDSYGDWVKTSYPSDSIANYNESLGIIRVPFSQVSYDSDSHEYVCRKWTNNYGNEYTNIHIGFVDNRLTKISYNITSWGVYRETECLNYGSASVTIPQEGGGNHPTPEQLNDLVRNKVYAYDSALDDDGEAGYSSSQLNAFFAGNKISFFTDNSFELIYKRVVNYSTGEVANNEMVLIGTYQVQEDARRVGQNPILLSVDKIVIDGVLKQENAGGEMLASIKPNENQVTVFEHDSNKSIEVYFALNSSATPEHIQYETEPQQESKWPAADIAAKLKQLGIGVSIPAPDSAYEAFISEVAVTPAADNESLSIVVTGTSADNAQTLFYLFMSSFNSSFTSDYGHSSYGEERTVLAYLNETKDALITLAYDINSSVVTIVVSKYSASTYPGDQIAAFFRKNELTTPLPELAMNGVAYSFYDFDTGCYLTIEPMDESVTADTILAYIDSILPKNGFKVMYTPAKGEDGEEGGYAKMYIDPAIEYFVSFEVDAKSGQVMVVIYIGGEGMKEEVSFSYPEEALNQSYALGVRDALPNLAVSGAIYSFSRVEYEDDEYNLNIFMQEGMSTARALSDLQTRITRAGYAPDGDNKYVSANGQITLYIEVVEDKIINVNIKYSFEEEDVTYNFINTNDWDITVDEAEIYAYVWNNKGEFEWIKLEKNESGTFTVEISNTWCGVKFVRFGKDSDIDWQYGPDGEVHDSVIIHNESRDYVLSGQSGDLEFFLEG